MAIVTVSVVFATVFGVYIAWRSGEYALNSLLYENSAFSLQHIEIQTDGEIALDQLRRWAGVRTGQNLLALDLARVKRDLEMIPIVRFASVERVLPRTLRIRVQERVPIAQVNIPRPKEGGGLEVAVFHLDAEGWAILPLEVSQRAVPIGVPPVFPVLTGISANQIQAGRRIDLSQALAALNLVAAFEDSPMAPLVDLASIDVSAPEVLIVSTPQGGEITFGLSNPAQQLRRWREVFDSGQRHGRSIASLDLAVSNNIPVRWLEASAAPAVPRSTKSPIQKTRKKHV
jgi:cell division protein FtsQ